MTEVADGIGALVRDDGVYREIYRDPGVFALEMERIFKQIWVFMAHDSELTDNGDYLTMRIGTEPAILVRGEDGTARVLVKEVPAPGRHRLRACRG